MKLINNFIVNVQNKFFNNHRSTACKVNVFFLIRARNQRARVEARSAISVKRFYLIKYCFNQHHFFPKTFSNDPYQILRWKFFLASIGKNFLASRKKIDWFPTAADKLINDNNNIIFFENSMIWVPSIASWEFTNQISTKSVEY